MASIGTRLLVFFTALLLVVNPGHARDRRRHAAVPKAVPASAAPPRSFYPDEIEGGVKGNLPFNNQVRKHIDPLNANGGK